MDLKYFQMKLSILIPCLNEETTITRAVERADEALKKAKQNSYEIIVADNGSTDGSIEKVKKQKKARLINVTVKGYGAALHWGILNSKAKYVLFADADLSYDFDELYKFLKVIKTKEIDLILGSRLKGKIEPNAMPFLNRFLGTPILTWLIRFIYHLPTSDCNSGMRLIRKNFYKKLNLRNSGMEWASELLIKTALAKGRYVEVPINFYKDKRNRPPHLVPWSDGWRHLKAIILIKPNILFIPTFFFLFASLFTSYFSFSISAICFFMFENFLLCLLAAKLLNFSIDGTKSYLASFTKQLPIVSLAIILMFLELVLILLPIPHVYDPLIMFLGGVISIYILWVFFIETIKTHLINRLP